MTEQKEFKVNNFDLLRLFAATQVIVDHYFQHLNIPISNSALKILYLFPGVPVFFTISGYLISASYERNNSLVNYFKNRALRIYPGLWACIFITIIIFSFTGISFFNKQAIAWLPAQLTGFIYTPKFLSGYGFGSYNGSLWTIPLELQFYILLPLCYLLAPAGKINYCLWGLLMVFISFNIFCGFSNFSPFVAKLLMYSFIPNFYLFLVGVILQRLRIYKSKFIYNKALYWVAGYVLFSLVIADYMDPVIFLVIKNILLACTVLSMAYTLPGLANKILKNNDISYGIYMYHGLILTVIVQLKLEGAINLYVIIFVAYVLGYLSWRFIERPFMRMKERPAKVI